MRTKIKRLSGLLFGLALALALLQGMAPTARADTGLAALGEENYLIPQSGTNTVDLAGKLAGESVLVYDEGGPEGDYGNKWDGTLSFTPPEGKALRITGTCDTETSYDNLYLYGGGTDNELLHVSGTKNDIDVSTVDRPVILRLKTDGSGVKSGVALTVTVIDCLTVTYGPNGGSGTMPTGSALPGIEFTLPGCGFTPPTGKAFSGWLSSVDGGVCQPGEPVVLTEDATFTAQWGDGAAVTFDSNGGSDVDTQYVLLGACATAPTKPTRYGYVFLYWTSGGSEFDFSSPITEDTTLTALWARGASIDEGGEDGQLPDGWTTSGDYVWTVDTDYYYYQASDAHSGTKIFKAKKSGSGGTAWLITPVMDLGAVPSATLDLWYVNRKFGGDIDGFGVYYRVNGGDWQEVFYITDNHDSWTELTLDLPDGALTANAQIGFKADSKYGYGVGLDDISLDAAPPHTHSWAYTADGATITAACAGVAEGVCVEPVETLEIVAPADLTADGQPKPATLSISGDQHFTGVDDDDIVYRQGDAELPGAPAEPGTYTASVTAGGATAEVEYTLAANVAKAVSANLTLGGALGLNFYLVVPDEMVAAGAKAVMEGPGDPKTREVVLSALAKDDEGRYKVSYPVAAIWTDKDVTLTLVDKDGNKMELHNANGVELEGDQLAYSVYDYFEAALADGSPLTPGEKSQIRATYTYCAYAIRWKYNTALPSVGEKGIDELPDVTAGSQEILAHKATATGEAPAGVNVTGITLLLDSDTSLRLYFTCDGDAPTVAIDGVEVAPEPAGKKGNKYYVQTKPIGVAFLGNRHTVSIGGTYTAELDAYSYVYAALRDQDDQALEDVCRALWAYGEAFQQARD